MNVRDEDGPATATTRVIVERWDVGTTPKLLDRTEVTVPAGQTTTELAGPGTARDERIIACIDVEGDGCATGATLQPDGVGDLASVLWRVPGLAYGIRLTPSESTAATSTTAAIELSVIDAFGADVPTGQARIERYRRTSGNYSFVAPATTVTSGDIVNLSEAAASMVQVLACFDTDSDGCAAGVGATIGVDPDEATHARSTVTFAEPGVAVSVALERVGAILGATGETRTVTATARDAFGDPVSSGTTVTLADHRAAPGSDPVLAASPTGVTDANGTVAFALDGPDDADVAVLACLDVAPTGCGTTTDGDGNPIADGTEPASATVVLQWRTPGLVAVIGTVPATQLLSSDATGTVTLSGFDAFGDAADAGQDLTEDLWRSDDDGATFTLAGTGAVTLGAGGVVDATLVGPEVDAIVVALWCPATSCGTVETGGLAREVNGAGVATVQWVTPRVPALIEVEQSNLIRATAASDAVAVRVLDAFGDPVVGATVTVETYRDDVTTPVTTDTIVTDGSGETVLVLTGPGVEAEDAVWLCVDEDSDGCTTDLLTGDDRAATPVFVSWLVPGAPAQIDLRPRRAQQEPGDVFVLDARVTDASGLEVPATTVLVQVLDVGGGGAPTSIVNEDVVTDGDGSIHLERPGAVADTTYVLVVCTDADNDDTCIANEDGRIVRDPGETVGQRGVLQWKGLV